MLRGEKSIFCVCVVITEPDDSRSSVSFVPKAGCSSPDPAPHFLPQINRINVLKSDLVGFCVKLPGWKNNRRCRVAPYLERYHMSHSGFDRMAYFCICQSDFCFHPARDNCLFYETSTFCCDL